MGFNSYTGREDNPNSLLKKYHTPEALLLRTSSSLICEVVLPQVLDMLESCMRGGRAGSNN
jgi:hypothetical protein